MDYQDWEEIEKLLATVQLSETKENVDLRSI
jgi:hypothetical protein